MPGKALPAALLESWPVQRADRESHWEYEMIERIGDGSVGGRSILIRDLGIDLVDVVVDIVDLAAVVEEVRRLGQ